ncbi:hypothetical protein ACQ4LE_007704 [Meloidogyne hapla]
MEKYAQIRDIFEERILKAARMFQEHDRGHILQMKKFFLQLATLLETKHNSNAKTTIEYRQNLELIDIEEIMLKFIEEKGTGTDIPKKLNWTEADELPQELDVLSAVHSHSSSSNNSSAIVAPNTTFSSVNVQHPPPTAVNDLLSLDDQWGSSTGTNLFESAKSSSQRKSQQQKMQRFKQSASEADEEDSDSNSENTENGQQTNIRINTSDNQQQQQSSSISTVQQQISSWLGRQKQAASHWRLKKHSASQSSLPAAVANEMAITNEKLQSNNHFAEFSKSCGVNEGKGGGGSGLSKRYQKKINVKNSNNEITQTKMKRAFSQFQLEGENCDISAEEPKIKDPLQIFGPPPPLPIAEPPPPLFDNNQFNSSPNFQNVSSFIFSDEKQQNIPNYNISHNTHWSADSSSSDDEDNSTQFQTTKIRQLQIRPLDEHQEFHKNTSLDELRSAIGQIGLPKSSTIDNDPWAASDAETTTSADISIQSNQITSQVIPPLRAALTGDSQYRRCFAPSNDFGQSFSIFSTSNSIARARPRSHTPLIFGPTSSNIFSKPQMTQIPLNQNINSTSNIESKLNTKVSSTINPSPTSISDLKLPIALATNDCIHCWIKKDFKPEIRIFGTILLSLPSAALQILQNSSLNSPLKFTFKCAQIKSLIPNQLFGLTSNNIPSLDNCYNFSIEREKLRDFLQDQQIKFPMASYHNTDLMHYELFENINNLLPISLRSFWSKIEDSNWKIRIEYQLKEFSLKNISFTTKLTTTKNLNEQKQFLIINSEPEAKLDSKNNIIWEFNELSKNCNGILNCEINSKELLLPSNTFVQFQAPNNTISNAEIILNDNINYMLSVFRCKFISGKYFCEPEII